MAIFFNQRKTRGFNYIPRFYDPDAEEREQRKKVVLGEKYRSPEQLAHESEESRPDYVPGTYLREYVAARRGNAHAADVIRKRRRKTLGMPILLGVLVVAALVIWMLYFKR